MAHSVTIVFAKAGLNKVTSAICNHQLLLGELTTKLNEFLLVDNNNNEKTNGNPTVFIK